MSRGGGFRGRGYGPHGHHRQGPGPDLSGGSGSVGNLGPRYSGSRQDGPGLRPSGLNSHHDRPNLHSGGPNFNQRVVGPSRGPCPNFNHSRRTPGHQNRGSNNWSPRGASPQFQSWRGARTPHFNGPPRAFHRGRGQGQHLMPRFPFVPTGNFAPPFLPYQQVQEPKSVEKPAVPHLGSEEERKQKITEAADALKRKLSAVAREPDEWRDDDDEVIVESSQDTDHDSRIATKGIPELKHDPPELNLTLSDLRDIGRVDHEHRTEQSKINAETDHNYEFDESEVKILAHNPVKPRIEIDLYGDDNYGNYAEDESENRTTEEMEMSSHMQEFPSTCDSQSFNEGCTFGGGEDHRQQVTNTEIVDGATQREITTMENVIEQPNEAVSQCNTKQVNPGLQMDENYSDRCEKEHEATANDCTKEITATNDANNEKFQRAMPIEESEKREPENCNDEQAITDNSDNPNVKQTITDFEGEAQETDKNNSVGKTGENWVELSNTPQSNDTRIPGLDSLYPTEITAQPSEESKSCSNVELAINNESKIEQNNILKSVVESTIVKKEIKQSGKEVRSENLDKTLTGDSEVENKLDKRVKNVSVSQKDDTSRATRHETPDDRREHNKDRACSRFSDKMTNEAKPDAITTTSSKAVVRQLRDEGKLKICDNRSIESSNKINIEENRRKSRDRLSKNEKTDNSQIEKQMKNDSSKKTDSRIVTEPAKTIDISKDKFQSKIIKTNESSSRSVKKVDDRDADKDKDSLNDKKNQERKRLVRNMTQVGSVSRSRAALVSDVPPDFDPREPPPMSFTKNLFSKPPPSMVQTNQHSTETPHIPPAFDPRLSSSARNALLSTVSSISSVITSTQDFTINQAYPSQNITNFPPIVSAINYGSRPIIPPTVVESSTANIQPICLGGDPYSTLLPLPNLPIATPIVIPADNSQLLPPLPAETPLLRPPPPLSSSRKSNIDLDDGLEDMQEAMKFAKQLMNMDEPVETAEETNSIDSDFFHMPTFPDLPPIVSPPFLPFDIPTPPEVGKVSSNRQTKTKESKKSKSSKQDNDTYGPQLIRKELRENKDSIDETGEKTMDLTGDERPKVMFNLNSKSKILNKDNEWIQQQNREDAAEAAEAAAAAISRFSPLKPAVAPPSTDKIRLINDQEDLKKSHNVAAEKIDSNTSKSNSNNSQNVEEKIDAKSSKFTSNNSENKKPEESRSHPQIHSKSRSPSPGKSNQTKQAKNADLAKSEILPRKITKESTAKKSSEETPESLWKNRVIGRFLKMSKNDICNMLNNTGLRKFDIAMKHLVKERTSTLSLNMRKKEEEKLKDPEASYNREEFMDQLSAMLDPSATVDVCNLPTQFLHHLSEVLQLESMSEFGGSLTSLDNVEASTSSPTQQTALEATRLSRENANGKEIDYRRSSKRGREKISTSAASAVAASVVTSSARNTQVRKSLRSSEESIVPKHASKMSNIAEEIQKIPTLESIPRRRRLQRQTMLEQPETSTSTGINGSTSRDNANSVNMAVVDDLFTEGIAKAKKKIIQPSNNDKNTGSSVNDKYSNQTERYGQLAKDCSVDRVERTAVELDKIFTAGIAKAKLASRKAAAAAAIASEANDGDDDEDDAGCWYNDNKSNTHNHRLPKHRLFSRHLAKCEKWNRRKAREDPDGFRNLTREEWEAKYGETSDSTYEREYRAMVDINYRKTAHSPTNYRDVNDVFGEAIAGGSSSGSVMLRLGNIVPSGSGVHESWNDSENDRRLRNDFDNADYQIESYNNSSSSSSSSSQDDSSSTSTTSTTTSQYSETKSPEVPSVTELLKVIKAREKMGKKKSLNQEIRDEVNADIERKRRERGKVGRKEHKSRPKKSHRRRKEKKFKVREKKKRLRKRKKRRSRRTGSENETSGHENSDEEGTSSLRKQGQLLTEEEIKQEMDVVVVVKDEPENEIEQPAVEKQQNKTDLPITALDKSRSSCISSTITPNADFSAATISPSQMKTKAQLKQLPPDLFTKSVAVAEILNKSSNKQATSVNKDPKEKANKVEASSLISTGSPVVSEPSSSPQSTNTSSSGKNKPSTIISTENLPSKSHSKKLDFNAYKERTRLRVLRENEKIRMINENPSSLTQNLLNIPLTRKKVSDKNENAGQVGEQYKNPTLTKITDLPTTTISDATVCATSKIVTSNDDSAKVSTIDIATTNTKTSTIVNTLETSITNVNHPPTSTANATSDFSTTIIKASATSNNIDKTSAIKTTTTDKTSATKTTTTAEIRAISTMPQTTKSSSTLGTTTTDTLSVNTTISTISSIVEPSKVPDSQRITVQQSCSATKAPTKKLIRRRSVTKQLESESTLIEARVEAGKFAHIKSEGSKEMKLREKLKKGRQRVCSEGLETTIPLVHPIRLKKRPTSLVRNAEQSTSLVFPQQQKIDQVVEKRKYDYFKKGIISDLLPDTVPQELLATTSKISTTIDVILEQPDVNSNLSLPIAELSSWPLDSSISSNIIDNIDTSASPPFKGFPAEPILRRDRVLTEAELNPEIDALQSVSLAFEDGAADALPMSTVVDLNDLRSTGIPLNEPISYGDEEFVEGRVEIETTLLGFSVTNDIPDDPEAIATLGDHEFVAQTVDRSLNKYPEESRESIDTSLPRVTSTLNDSPATVDFLITEVQRPESIPSPLLVTESARDGNDESVVTDFSNNHLEENKKNVIASCDVTSSHESHATGDVYLETAGPDSETSSSRITSNAENKKMSFRTEATNNKSEDASEAEEMHEKITFFQDKTTKDVPTTNSTVEMMMHDPRPQPSSSSDSTEERGKELVMENQRDVSDTRDNETKPKVSSHHNHSKSRDHLHGKTKRKSSRHHNHESKTKKKGVITEKMVKEAVVSNIVKLVPKPTSKETVMARMIEIDVEIHKLMNEKMTLYKMLESGEFPIKDDRSEADRSVKTNSEPKMSSETEETREETVPPTVLASRLVRDLDKTVLPTPAIVHDNSNRSDGKKAEAEDEAKKVKQNKSPHREMKTRTRDNAAVENRRKRKISESKRHSRTTTSEESSRQDTTSTHSREKSTSSTEFEDAEENNHQKQRTKSLLVHRSPNRRTSKRSRQHSSKEDVGEGCRESTERSPKLNKQQQTRNLLEESAATKINKKKKMKNFEAKKSEEKAKTQKEQKKTNADSKVTHKNEMADKKTISDGERTMIYSDESNLDSPGHEAIQADEQRGKNDSGPSTGLALLEESFKREMAETRKHKTMEKRKVKKQELRRIVLDSSTLTSDQANKLKKESVAPSKAKDKLGSTKVMKHITTVIDAVAENRIQQLYNDNTSSESKDSFSETSSIRGIAVEDNGEENVFEISEEATKTTEAEKPQESKPGDSNDSRIIAQPIKEEKAKVEEITQVSDAKTTSGKSDPQETTKDNSSNERNTKKSSEIDINVEESIKNVEPENPGEKSTMQIIDNIDEPENLIKTPSDLSGGKEEDRQDKINENQLLEAVHKSELVADREKEIEETIKNLPCPTPQVKDTIPKTTANPEKNLKPKAESENQIPEKESVKDSRNSHEKESESSKEKRNAKDTETDRSKSRNKRSAAKQRNVVLSDGPSKEKKQNLVEKDNSLKGENSKDEDAKPSNRPRSAKKGRQREKSVPPSRRSSRNPDDSGKTSRSKKREKSSSRGTSPYEGEPARKKTNNSRRSSSPIVQIAGNEDYTRRRGRKRKRRSKLSREEMASCKVMLIDCKYTYLSPRLHPRILKKWGISRINPWTPPTSVPENSASTKLSRHSTPVLNKVEFSEDPEEFSNPSKSSTLESTNDPLSSPKERPLSPQERASSPSERPSSPPKERSSSPRDRPSSSLPRERSSSPKQLSSPVREVPPLHRVPKPISSSPEHERSSPKLINTPLPADMSNRVEVDEDDDDDDDDDVFDETIQIVKAGDENIVITSQSEDEEVEGGVMDVVKATKDVADIGDEAVDVAQEDPDVMNAAAAAAEEEADAISVAQDETADVIDAAEEETNVVDATEEETDVRDTVKDIADVVPIVEEPTPPPDSTADDDIAQDLGNQDNSHHEKFQQADTTDEVELLEENITIVDKPTEIHVLHESEAADEDVEPRRTRYTVHKGPILDIKVLDDSFLAASEDGAIYRYSQQSNGILNIYKGHEAAVTCIYVMKVAKFWKLYSGSLDGSFRCYDITSGLQERPPADVGSPVQCMDQAWGVFFVGTKSGHISRYNIKSGSIKGDRLEFSDNSVLALKASSEGPRRILIVASRNQPITIRDALTGLFLRIICGYKNHTVYSLMRERNLVYCGTSSTSIPVFDFTNGEQITQYNAGVGIVCMRLYRQILFAGCYDGNIYVFDTKETKLICNIPGPGNMLLSIEIVGDEIIAGSKDRQLHSWRMPRQLRILLAERA